MRVCLTLLALAGAFQFAAIGAFTAAAFQHFGSPYADTIGFSGIGIAALGFVVASIFIWKQPA